MERRTTNMNSDYELEVILKKASKKYIKNEILAIASLMESMTIKELHSMFFPCNVVPLVEFAKKYVRPLITTRKLIAPHYDSRCFNEKYLSHVRVIFNEKMITSLLKEFGEVNSMVSNERDCYEIRCN